MTLSPSVRPLLAVLLYLTASRAVGQAPLTPDGKPPAFSAFSRTISLDMEQGDLRKALRAVFEAAGVNYAIDSDLEGKVTVHFKDLPLRQALMVLNEATDEHFRVNYGFGVYRARNRSREEILVEGPHRYVVQSPFKHRLNFIKAADALEALKKSVQFGPDIAAWVMPSRDDNSLVIQQDMVEARFVREAIRLMDIAPSPMLFRITAVTSTTDAKGRVRNRVTTVEARGKYNESLSVGQPARRAELGPAGIATGPRLHARILARQNGDASSNVAVKADLALPELTGLRRLGSIVLDGEFRVWHGYPTLAYKAQGFAGSGAAWREAAVRVFVRAEPLALYGPREAGQEGYRTVAPLVFSRAPSAVSAAGMETHATEAVMSGLAQTSRYDVLKLEVIRKAIEEQRGKMPDRSSAAYMFTRLFGNVLTLTGEIVSLRIDERENRAVAVLRAALLYGDYGTVLADAEATGRAGAMKGAPDRQKLARAALEDAARRIPSAFSRWLLPSGSVLRGGSRGIVVDAGQGEGIRPGMRMIVQRNGRVVGMLQVTASHDGWSEAKQIQGTAGVREQDFVQPVTGAKAE